MDIIYPSDIKIKLTSITDTEGNIIDPQSISLIFIITDEFNKCYKAAWNHSDPTKCKHTKYEGGYLYVLIEDYNLYGQLYWQIGTQLDDSMFEDGVWNWINERSKLDDIVIVRPTPICPSM